MSNNTNNEDVTLDEVVEENLYEETTEEVVENIAVKYVEIEQGGFVKNLIASILDQAVVLGCGALLLVAFDLIIRVVGFRVVTHIPMLLIMYVIANILYYPLFSRVKDGRSIGKRIMNII